MRVVGLHPGVLVATSRVFQTACTVVRDGEELEGGQKPDAEVKTFRDAGKLLKAA